MKPITLMVGLLWQTAAAKSDQIAREERQKLDDMREEMSKLKEKKAVLESDLSLTRAQLEREQGKAEQAIKEKFGMEASRKVGRAPWFTCVGDKDEWSTCVDEWFPMWIAGMKRCVFRLLM